LTEKFQVPFLEDTAEFPESLNENARDKVTYNIQKAKRSDDKKLFNKLKNTCLEKQSGKCGKNAI
jgi:hypothetical protein